MKNKYHKEKFNAQIHTTCKIKNQSFNPTKKLTLLKIIIEFFGGRRSVDYEDGNFDRIPIVKIVRIFSFFLSSPIFVEDEVNFDNENFYSKFQTFFFLMVKGHCGNMTGSNGYFGLFPRGFIGLENRGKGSMIQWKIRIMWASFFILKT